MKKIISLFALFLGLAFCLGQYGNPQITHDIANASNMTKQIATSSQQLTEMKKTIDFMKKTQETLTRVSTRISELNQITEIEENYRDALAYARKATKKIEKYEDNADISKGFSNSIKSINSSILFLQKVLSSNFFNMSDFERIQLIKEELTKSRLTKNKMKILAR